MRIWGNFQLKQIKERDLCDDTDIIEQIPKTKLITIIIVTVKNWILLPKKNDLFFWENNYWLEEMENNEYYLI